MPLFTNMDRRSFLFGAAALAGVADLTQIAAATEVPMKPLPSKESFSARPEQYWKEVREQFVIPKNEIYLNNGTVGSCPLPVLKAVIDGYLEGEKLAQAGSDEYPLWGYGALNEVREPLAKFVGANVDEIAIVRNATEANNFIANGLELASGDEVLMSDEEHPGGEEGWQLRAKRHGIVVKKFALPKSAKSAAEILNRINDAITPRTRVIFVSHVSYLTGLVMPVKEICALARTKGILSAVDGAQAIGMFKFNIHEIGCDLYSTSPHKWLQAPKGTGMLFVREEVQPKLWNTIAGEGWARKGAKAERFQMLGTSNLPAILGLKAAVQFANDIGIERIEQRHRELADSMRTKLIDAGAEPWTPADGSLRCAMVTVNAPKMSSKNFQDWVWKTHRIRIKTGEPSRMRLSTAYYLQPHEIERFAEVLREYQGRVSQQS